MASDLATVYHAADPSEAHFVKDLLIAEGMDAQVVGDRPAFAGLTAVSKIEVVVRIADKNRALELISQYEQERSQMSQGDDWTCPQCGKQVPASFDHCAECEGTVSADQGGSTHASSKSESTSISNAAALVSHGKRSEAEHPAAEKAIHLNAADRRVIWLETCAVLSFVATFYFADIAVLVWPEKYPILGWHVDNALWIIVRDLNVICVVAYLICRSGPAHAAFGLVRPVLRLDLPVAGCVFLAYFLLWILCSAALPAASLSDVDSSLLPPGWWAKLLVVSAICQGAVMEELLMRCYLITRFEQLFKSAPAALLLCIVLYTGYHLHEGSAGLLAAALGGLVYGCAFLLFRRLWPIALAHAAFNLIEYWQ